MRYQPIAERLKEAGPDRVLDVGSGPEGARMFWRGNVFGMDLAFKRRPLHVPIIGSGLNIPFSTGGFDTVVACDYLEHVPPEYRRQAVGELTRVAGRRLLVGFPAGGGAEIFYRSLVQEFGDPTPSWLGEHIKFGLPDADIVAGWIENEGYEVSIQWYEPIEVHRRWLLAEEKWGLKWLTYPLMRIFGENIAASLPVSGKEPFLRVLIEACKLVN